MATAPDSAGIDLQERGENALTHNSIEHSPALKSIERSSGNKDGTRIGLGTIILLQDNRLNAGARKGEGQCETNGSRTGNYHWCGEIPASLRD
ncbi:MAG TPA: hypothetical protein VGF71_12290 [Caulobacteraceae bacterium]